MPAGSIYQWWRRGLFLCLALVVSALPSGPGRTSSITISDLQPAVPQDQVGLDVPAPEADGVAGVIPGPGGKDGSPSPGPTDFAAAGRSRVKPLVAIIIDDMGQNREIGRALMELDLDLTFSFLPRAPFTPELAEEAWQKGRDILVHMPMEPRDPAWDPGPGTLYLKDSMEDRTEKIVANLAAVPYAIGVNNHMGSRYTADRAAMVHLLEHLQGAGLFFIDSITAPESVARETAAELGVRSARRNVFLDNIPAEDDICRQLKKLVARADRRGRAIGIGHPGPATLRALESCRRMLCGRVRVVGIRELVE